jgi:hypothetical protein
MFLHIGHTQAAMRLTSLIAYRCQRSVACSKHIGTLSAARADRGRRGGMGMRLPWARSVHRYDVGSG